MPAEDDTPLEDVLVMEEGLWADGPPVDLFRRLRSECPVHWSSEIPILPEEAGFWSVTTAEGVREVSLDWETYSSERGGITAARWMIAAGATLLTSVPTALASVRSVQRTVTPGGSAAAGGPGNGAPARRVAAC